MVGKPNKIRFLLLNKFSLLHTPNRSCFIFAEGAELGGLDAKKLEKQTKLVVLRLEKRQKLVILRLDKRKSL
jgi:hypothetical protein